VQLQDTTFPVCIEIELQALTLSFTDCGNISCTIYRVLLDFGLLASIGVLVCHRRSIRAGAPKFDARLLNPGRFMSAVHDLNHHIAHHKYDVSNEIEGRVRDANKSSGLHPFTVDPRDLVTKLLQDTSSKWKQLLDNEFCKKMKTTHTTDNDYKQVENKFKWYMITSFIAGR